MNTKEVVAMMNAITEGRNYDMVIEGDRESDEAKFQFAGESFAISHDTRSFGVTEIDNPRTAREIAGALVAWANRKDGQLTANLEAFLKVTEVKPNEDAGWRATWYRRSVGIMSQEAKNRNLKDLTAIQAELHPNDVQQVDIAAAIQILVDNGAMS